jgi:diguanylate cyclase (GGDEF)-like protein/PAS domain S-box-containing protein
MGIQMTFIRPSMKNILLAILLFINLVFISHNLLNIRTEAIIKEKYTQAAHEIQFTTQSYIDAKKESVLFIALSLANDPRYINAIASSNETNFELDKFSENIRRNTKYKNVWIQVSDSKGISLYRSWTDKHGDDLTKVRKDIVQMIRDPKVTSTISTGIYDMAFKAMVPIFKDNKFIGTIEVISKFNSISNQLLDKGFGLVLLVDKAYKDQIKKPFTKMFLDDYYVANLNASESNRNYIQNFGIEKLIYDTNTYIIDQENNIFITKHIQRDLNAKKMGYFILFYPLDKIDLNHTYFFHYIVLFFISLLLIGIYLVLQLVNYKHNKEKADLRNKILSKEVEEKNIELEEQHIFLQSVINGIDQSVMVIDKEFNILLANDAAKKLSDIQIIEDLSQSKCYELLHHQNHPCDSDVHCPLIDTFDEQKDLQRVHKHITTSGEEQFVELTTTPLYNKDHELYAIVELGHDITEHLKTQKVLEEQKDALNYQAHYDALTSLPNRVLFIDRLKHSMDIAKRDNNQVALIFIDLDHFKEINDSIGHHAGDYILKECAKRLKSILRKIDTVSRFGGDEFTIILEKMNSENEIVDTVLHIIDKLQEPYIYEHRKLYCGASVGISIYPENGNTHQELLKNADAAMYKAKGEGRSTYSFYTKAMTKKAHERVILETKLREAIKNDAFTIYYQPLINIKTHEVIGYEALLRWIDLDGTIIYPVDFISIAEQTGLIIDIGKVILESVLLQAVSWKKMNMNYEKISINISAKQLKDPEFLPFIEELLQRTKCNPDCIEFEIIESFIIDDITGAINVLEKIKKIGINISLDDFGTGYSSLSYLKKLPINKLKIDKSFIDDIPFDENDKIITKTIINLANDMNIEVLAEGVETIEQEQFLIENGCNLAQGYLYDRALSVDEINKKVINKS